jgi:hypothetical protein
MSLKLNSSGGGSVTLQEPTTASNVTLNLPAADGTVVYENASGNVGIGTTSPAVKLDVLGGNARVALSSGSSTTLRGYEIATATTVVGSLRSNADSGELRLEAGFSGYGGISTFYTNGSERARIDSSGNLLVGKTSTANNATGFYVAGSGNADHGMVNVARPPNTTMIQIVNSSGNTVVGQVSQNGSNTTYSTSSDYRLKENIAPMTGALSRVAALKPCVYTWKATGETDEGFIAHELAEVCPSAVTGEKDAVNEDGSIKPQGIDTSFLVATLTAAIQELKAEVDSLRAQVEAQ